MNYILLLLRFLQSQNIGAGNAKNIIIFIIDKCMG